MSEEIRAWSAGRPEQTATLERDIKKRAGHIATTVELLIESPSAALRDRLRALEGEQQASVAQLASMARSTRVLPLPHALLLA